MNSALPTLNLLAGWIGVLLGFASGMLLGMCFHREDWLGGYASFRRRLYRLAHISFFGLGATNLLFWITVQDLTAAGASVGFASGAFLLGAVTMPLCCVLMAHIPKVRLIFAVPVLSLMLGAGMTLWSLWRDLAPSL